MKLNLDMMQMVLRTMPVLIMVLTVIVQQAAFSQQRNRLELKQEMQS